MLSVAFYLYFKRCFTYNNASLKSRNGTSLHFTDASPINGTSLLNQRGFTIFPTALHLQRHFSHILWSDTLPWPREGQYSGALIPSKVPPGNARAASLYPADGRDPWRRPWFASWRQPAIQCSLAAKSRWRGVLCCLDDPAILSPTRRMRCGRRLRCCVSWCAPCLMCCFTCTFLLTEYWLTLGK